MRIVKKVYRGVVRRISRMNERPRFDDSELNLNVGAGNNKLPGFISLDVDSLWYSKRGVSNFRAYNMLSDNLPAEDGSVSNVYCSHVIEHIPNEPVMRFFHEAYRVLMPGGVLRIACPDAKFLWDVSSFDNSYWRWRDRWFNGEISNKESGKPVERSSYFIREVATPSCKYYKHRRRDFEYSDEIFNENCLVTLENICKNLEFDENFPGDHINAWYFDKVKSFGLLAAFSRIVESKRNGSVSFRMQQKEFDTTCPQMSLYVDLVK